ncbi:MAG: DUF6883 domain-containing protein [Acidobacteriota bacterium]
MVLPNADRAQIDPDKLHGYLLSSIHPIGRFKARFFNALGFRADNWRELEQAFRIQHLTQDAEPAPADEHGQRYTIRAILIGPTGQAASVVSVWFIGTGGNAPRFITAYPGDTP